MRNLARIVGGFVLILGILGILSGDTQILNAMNVDPMLDMLRLALGVILIASSFMNEKAIRTAFAIFGIAYIANFAIALISPSMFGMLPNNFGIIDNLLHLGGGLLGIAVAMMPAKKTQASRA